MVATALLLMACNGSEASTPREVTDRIDASEDVETCAWPGAVWVRFVHTHLGASRRCGGTLIHPQVVVTSALCAEPYPTPFGAYIGMGAIDGSEVDEVHDIEYCEFSPDYDFGGIGTDPGDNIAFCVLEAPVEHPLVPAAMGCEMTAVYPGATATLVGYGSDNSVDIGNEWKRWGEASIAAIWPDINGLVELEGDTTFCAASDQGGPAMTRLPDGSWRVFGIMVGSNSTNGTSTSCAGNTYVLPLDRQISWIEENSGFDVTPCFDGDGSWNPGPDCQAFYAAEPNQGFGSFQDQCMGTPVSGYSDICGAPYEDEEQPGNSDDGAGDTGETGDTGAESSGGDSSGPSGGGTEDAGGNTDGDDDAAQDGETGCACHASAGTAPSWAVLVGSVGLLAWRRRRRRTRRP